MLLRSDCRLPDSPRRVTEFVDLLHFVPVDGERPAIGHDHQTETAPPDFADRLSGDVGQFTIQLGLGHSSTFLKGGRTARSTAREEKRTGNDRFDGKRW